MPTLHGRYRQIIPMEYGHVAHLEHLFL